MTALITDKLNAIAAEKAADDFAQGQRAQDHLLALGDFGNNSHNWRLHITKSLEDSLNHIRKTLHAEVDGKIDGVIKEAINLIADYDHSNQQTIINLIRSTQDLQKQYVG